MNFKKISSQPLELTNNLERTNFIIEKPANQVPKEGGEYNSNIFSIPTVIPAIVGAMCIYLGMKFNKVIQKRLSNLDKVSQKFPCGNCKYFENNPYLKCSVQPKLVLKKEANNCKDYQTLPRDEGDINSK